MEFDFHDSVSVQGANKMDFDFNDKASAKAGSGRNVEMTTVHTMREQKKSRRSQSSKFDDHTKLTMLGGRSNDVSSALQHMRFQVLATRSG